MRSALYLLAGAMLLVPATSSSQGMAQALAPGATSTRTLQVARATAPIAIDGRLGDAAWSAAAPAGEFVQFEPRPGAAATDRTEARVLYDDAAVYVALRMYDAAPDSIVAQLARRDQAVYSDWALVGIDGYHDRRSALLFAVNAAGVMRDIKVSEDNREDETWDAVWEAAVAIDSLGWTAELRIPLAQLRFSRAAAGGEGRTWGINFRRTVARRNEVSYWSPVPNDAAALVSYFGELHGLASLEPPRRVEIAPYSMARLTRAPGETTDPFYRRNALVGSVGADIKVGLGSALTLSATVNPDFGQVDADPSLVNLSAYEVRFDERRPFFVEGSEFFRMSGPQLFYSRRIGRPPQGALPASAAHSDVPEAATILAAAKVSGRTAGGWSIGFLDALTSAEDARYTTAASEHGTAKVEPLTNYAVGRVARDFRGGRSSIGGLFTATHRQIDEGSLDFLRRTAWSAGIDGRHRFAAGRWELTGVVIGSHVAGDTLAIARAQRGPGHYFQRPDADHLEYDPSRRSMNGASASASIAKVAGGHWRWGTTTSATTPAFEVNDIGFNSVNDRASQNTYVGYSDFNPGGALRRWSVRAQQYSQITLGGERIEMNGTLTAGVELLNGIGGNLFFMRHTAGIAPDALRGGPALRNPGRYMLSLDAYTDRRKPVTASASMYWEPEDETASNQLHLGAEVAVRPSTRTELSLAPLLAYTTNDWQYVTSRALAGAPHYVLARLRQTTATLAARASYTFSPTLSFQFYAEPFISAGDYSGLKTVRDSKAVRFADRFHRYDDSELVTVIAADGSRSYRVDGDGDGTSDFSLADPDFNFKQVRSNAVVRWEYRPGSTLFVVWSQDRTALAPDGSFGVGRDLRRLFDADGRNVLLVKLSYWLGM